MQLRHWFHPIYRFSAMPPNPAVNTDAPRAGHRPRRGSPVTFVRWAAQIHRR